MDDYTARVAVATVLCNDPGWQQGDIRYIRIIGNVWTWRRNDLRYELSGTVDDVLVGTWRVEQFDTEGCAEPSARQVWLIHFRETEYELAWEEWKRLTSGPFARPEGAPRAEDVIRAGRED